MLGIYRWISCDVEPTAGGEIQSSYVQRNVQQKSMEKFVDEHFSANRWDD